MEVSTVDFYAAIKEIAQGNTANAETNAKKVSDYVEQTKQTNYATLKDVFLTKDDKADIMNKFASLPATLKDVFLTKDDKIDLVNKINDSKWDMIKVLLGIFAALALMIIGLYLKK